MLAQRSNSRKRKSYASMDVEKKSALLHSRRLKYRERVANRGDPGASTSTQSTRSQQNYMHRSSVIQPALLNRIEDIPFRAWSLPFSTPCPFCGAFLYLREPKGYCCLNGQISLVLPTMPHELWTLYTSLDSADAVHFRKRCRIYNNTTAFSSLGITYDESLAKSNKDPSLDMRVYNLPTVNQEFGASHSLLLLLIPGDTDNAVVRLLYILTGTIPRNLFLMRNLKVRPADVMNILRAGRLAQQYQIDCYVKIETQRLDYLRSEQRRENLHTESYEGIIDSMASQGKRRGSDIGQRFVLPASYVGSPRDMRRRYLNALALVSEYGRPDFFITMTCNPNWPEIRAGLLPREEAQNRSDLVARAFRGRHEEFKNDILRERVFGDVAAYLYI
ncbi:hypothetical protein OROMI_006119 [Orobanche minor]